MIEMIEREGDTCYRMIEMIEREREIRVTE